MELALMPYQPVWWSWLATFASMVLGLAGIRFGVPGAAILSLAHAALAWRWARDARAIGVRIRLAYAIVLLLCLPPWNRTERLSLDLLRRTLFSGVLVARRDLVDTVAAEGGYTGSME